MQNASERIQLLTHAPIPRALLALGLPTMLGMLINALYNLVDTYFVSGLGTLPLGAVTVAFPLGQVIVGLGLLFGNGAASYLSRLLGQGQLKKAQQVASTALYGSLGVGAAVIVLALILLRPLLQAMGANESLLPYALTYTRIYLAGSIFNVLSVTMNNIAASEGAAQMTMRALMSGALLNVLLDPLFIYTFDLGVAGAAIATVLSQLVSALIYLRYMLSGKSTFSYSLRHCCLSADILTEILKIGVPTLIFQLLTSLSIAMINSGAQSYGESALAAMGPVTKMMSLGSLMVFGFLKGMQPLAGYNYGAEHHARLQETITTALLWSTLFCTLFGLFMAALATPLMSLFTQDDAEMITLGTLALRANGLSFLVFGFYTVYSTLFLALGKAKEGFFLGACRQGICFIPLFLLLHKTWGLSGVLYAQPLADIFSAAITLFMAAHLHKTLARL